MPRKVLSEVRITVKNLQRKIPIDRAKVKRLILAVLGSEGKFASASINLCFVTDKIIKRLNARFGARNYATDVLAFDLSDKPGSIVADIAVSTQSAIRNASLFKTSPAYELYLYVVHGLLHILGYADASAQQRLKMERKANRYLSAFKIRKT